MAIQCKKNKEDLVAFTKKKRGRTSEGSQFELHSNYIKINTERTRGLK